MLTTEELQAEVDRLRGEVEAHRLRELAELRSQLAEAKYAIQHYREEAERNAGIGREISAEAQAQIAKLRAELDTARATAYGQRGRSAVG